MIKYIFLLSIIFFLFFPYPVFAVSVELSGVPSSITTDEFSVNVALAGASANTSNYIRAAFFAGSSTNYFGYTYNGSTFYNGTPSPIDGHQFLQIPIDSGGSWSGQLKVKLDVGSSAFKGSGSYSLKIGRYTASATSISDWSNIASVLVVAPSSTPTQSPTPTTSSKTTKSSTPTSSPTEKSVSQSSSSNITLASVDDSSNLEGGSESGEVLADSTQAGNLVAEDVSSPASPDVTQSVKILSASRFSWSFFFLAFGSLVLVVVCGILGFRYYKTRASNRE